MWISIIFLLLGNLNYITSRNNGELIDIFFADLAKNPKLKDVIFNEHSKQFIDKQVENYIALMEKSNNMNSHLLNKRSLPSDSISTLTQDEGVYMLDGFLPIYNIATQFPKDIVLFKHEVGEAELWYAASLEGQNKTVTNKLVIYKFNGTSFVKINSLAIHNGFKLAVYTIPSFSFIVLIENKKSSTNIFEKPGVYAFMRDEKINKIQSLDMEYASDASIWTQNGELFMAITRQMTEKNNATVDYEVDSPIYHWKGSHFDLVQEIRTYNAEKVLPFSIWSSHFLFFANHQNNKDELNIFSELFKYDLHSGQYILHQRILTYGIKDVKYFCFTEDTMKESFLIIANTYQNDNKIPSSIIYKYVDEYFLPFQSIDVPNIYEWLPVVGENGAFLLLAVSEIDGIRTFQYNGWNFQDTEIQYSGESFSRGLTSVYSYMIHNKPLLVVANENDNGDMINVFEPIFTHRNILNNFYNDMLSWCEQNIKKLQSQKQNVKKRQIEENINEEEVHNSKKKTEDLDLVINSLEEEIAKNNKKLEDIEEIIKHAVYPSSTNILLGNLFVDTLMLTHENNYFESLTSETINNVDIYTLQKNSISLHDDFSVGQELEFKSISVNNIFTPKYINKHPIEDLIHINKDNQMNNVTILGSVMFNDLLKIEKRLNNIIIDMHNILLKTGNQEFSGNLYADSIHTDNLYTKFINKLDIISNQLPSVTTTLEDIPHLNVKTLHLKKFINNIDIQELNRDCLKTSGDQEILNTYTFYHLHANNIEMNSISDAKIPEDLVLINEGNNYKIESDVQFINDLQIKNLTVKERLNHIHVTDGKLDVLLRNKEEKQHITGFKTFENIEVLHPIELQGQIHNEGNPQINPVFRIEDEVFLDGNYTITGNVTIENLLIATDVLAAEGKLSLKNLRDKGVRIQDKEIPLHLTFLKEIEVDELFTDSINGIYVNSFVISGSSNPQIITGLKTFPKDVIIIGDTNLSNVNGVDLLNFENNVLKVNGEQTMDGEYFIKSVKVNRIYGDKTTFDGHPWEDVMNVRDEKLINGTIIIDSPAITINHLQTRHLLVPQGLINNLNFDQIIEDTVFFNNTSPISGYKTFKNLTVNNLYVKEGMDMETVPKILKEHEGTFEIIEDDLELSEVHAKALVITESLNQIPIEKFRNAHKETSTIKIYGDHFYNKIIVMGNAFIEDGLINDISIKKIHENSVKVDEPFQFNRVTFVNGLGSEKAVTLNGEVVGLDLKNIVQEDNDMEIFIGNKNFHNNVTVYGYLFFNGLISGLNLADLCSFTQFPATAHEKELIIKGDVYFVQGPEVNYVNDVYLRDFEHITHSLSERSSTFETSHFETIIFEEDVIVENLVNNIDLKALEENYFSKTKDQTITANLTFNDGVVFQEGANAKDATIDADIYDINLTVFLETVLLNGVDQLFTSTINIQSCMIENLYGDYTVNNLNLETDVMRYDGKNMITGSKMIRNMTAYRLKIERDIKIQEVDIVRWLQDAILKSGSFAIRGKTIFKNSTVFENSISVENMFNNVKFDNQSVLLKTHPQTITGQKTFYNSEHPLSFKSLNIKGYLNNRDINEFFNIQAYNNEDIEFYSPINFHKHLNAKNIVVNGLYQGVNVSELLTNITNFAKNSTYQEKYNNLLTQSKKAQQSLRHQAFYLNYFKVIQFFSNASHVFPMQVELNGNYHLAVTFQHSKNCTIKFYKWDVDDSIFIIDEDVDILTLNKQVTFMIPFLFKRTMNVYVEYKQETGDEDKVQNIGDMYVLSNTKEMDYVRSIADTEVQDIKPVNLGSKQQNCLIVVGNNRLLIYCENIKDQNTLTLYKKIDVTGVFKVEALNIEENTFLVVIKRNLGEEAQVEIWKYDEYLENFNIHQVIYVVEPQSISTVLFKGKYYLSIASHVQDGHYPGLIDIRRFDVFSQQFVNYQDLNLQAPLQVEFAVLPSEELVLYVLTDVPTQPLIIFMYEGIAGFKETITTAEVPKVKGISHFSTASKHFICLQNNHEVILLQAYFKGNEPGKFV